MRSTKRRCPGWRSFTAEVDGSISQQSKVSLRRPLESRPSGPLGTWANVGSARSRAAAGAVGVGRRLGWLLMVIDVGLALMLLVGVLVGAHGRG